MFPRLGSMIPKACKKQERRVECVPPAFSISLCSLPVLQALSAEAYFTITLRELPSA